MEYRLAGPTPSYIWMCKLWPFVNTNWVSPASISTPCYHIFLCSLCERVQLRFRRKWFGCRRQNVNSMKIKKYIYRFAAQTMGNAKQWALLGQVAITSLLHVKSFPKMRCLLPDFVHFSFCCCFFCTFFRVTLIRFHILASAGVRFFLCSEMKRRGHLHAVMWIEMILI